MEVIVIESKAFYALFHELLKVVKEPEKERWIDSNEAMALLGIKSPTSLYKLRIEGRIAYSQPSPKIIKYCRKSIEAYLEENLKNRF